MPRPKTDTIKFLSQDEAGRLFHELGENKRNKAIFLVAYRHGLRASEVGLLRTSDLDFKLDLPPINSVNCSKTLME
jgi:integrase